MPNDNIPSLLAGLPRLSTLRKPPGTVAISLSAVVERAEESDVDMGDISTWITEQGGRLVKPPPVQSHGQHFGRHQARTVPAEAYYVLPLTALTE
jgi:hypothetical protein